MKTDWWSRCLNFLQEKKKTLLVELKSFNWRFSAGKLVTLIYIYYFYGSLDN